MKIKELAKEINKELNSLTIKELAENKENIQEDLSKLIINIQDFLSLINYKKRKLILKDGK